MKREGTPRLSGSHKDPLWAMSERGSLCLLMADCVFCHILCKEQGGTVLRLQNNGWTVSGSHPPCRPNLPTLETRGRTSYTQGPRVPPLQDRSPKRVQCELHKEDSQPATLVSVWNINLHSSPD